MGLMTADLDLVRRLAAADKGLAVVAVARADGTIHASVVNAGVFDAGVFDAGVFDAGVFDPGVVDIADLNLAAGGAYVAFVAVGSAKKVAHLRRCGRATIVFRAGWEWVSVEGTVRVIGPAVLAGAVADPRDRLPAMLRAIFTAAGGTHDDWATFDRVMAEEGRVAVLMTPERFITNG
jgi:hypothetical protein